MLLNLWSSPRNISTAIMYSFAQRRDTLVIDEPLYAHYLRHQPTEADHPGREEILRHQENDAGKVIEDLLQKGSEHPLVVAKQMTHHLHGLREDFKVSLLEGGAAGRVKVANVLLIRDPRLILASFAKVVDTVTAADVGIPQQYELLQRLRATGHLTAVVDARLLLLDPRGQLAQLCSAIGVDFDPSMLDWEAGARPEDGVWAKYWYANVHRSTGFQPYRHREAELPPSLEAVAAECSPHYEALLASAI